MKLNTRQRRTLERVFQRPTPGNIRWSHIEALIEALGGEIERDRAGSKVAFVLRGSVAVVHKPHPGSQTGYATVRDIRDFLTELGIRPK